MLHVILICLSITSSVLSIADDPNNATSTSIIDPQTRREISVFSKFLPPVSSFIVSYPDNGSWIQCGYAAFLLDVFCEQLNLRPIIDTSTNIATLLDLYHDYDTFRAAQNRFLPLYATGRRIDNFNQR